MLGLWRFAIVHPDADDGVVMFNMALSQPISDGLHAFDPEVWSRVLEEADALADEKALEEAE